MGRGRPVLGGLLGLLLCCSGSRAEDLGPVGAFSLTERDGRTITQADLLGKVWVASFVFTRCTGPCPQVSLTMAQLQKDFAPYSDVRLVTFTVDPEHDQPAELSEYASHFGADPKRWLFLTGKEDDIYKLLREGFHVPVEQNQGEQRRPGNEVMHSPRLVVVDRAGHIQGYFEGYPDPRVGDPAGEHQANLERLRETVRQLVGPDFPQLNAGLNGLAGVLLVFGYLAVRGRRVLVHKICMLAALTTSAVFLASYLYYHIVIKSGAPTHFADRAPEAPAWMGSLYLAILLSHTLLAAITAPLALFVTWQGLRGRLERHVRVARWTLPIWLYVSVTGVVVYWMLYRLYP
jgi:protein SCO1/2/putative membrane protein